MSAKNCLVIMYPTDAEPYLISDPKETYFSRKEAQKRAQSRVNYHKGGRAEVVQSILEVKKGGGGLI